MTPLLEVATCLDGRAERSTLILRASIPCSRWQYDVGMEDGERKGGSEVGSEGREKEEGGREGREGWE